MRRSNAWILLLAVLLVPTALVAKENQDKNTVEAATVQPSRQEICRMIEEAAAKERLPFDFFTRLIWRESRFDTRAVSPAGAQGIAQFMPKTANGRGLENPFDPVSALTESAEYLRELLQRFGNLGLAAAAYNAGPKRVQDWLAKRGPPLRQETLDYVEIITGHGPHKWTGGETPPLEAAEQADCDQVTKIAIARQIRIAAQAKRAPAQSEARKAEPAAPAADARERKLASARERKPEKHAGRLRLAASEQLSARSRPGPRGEKLKIADSRRKSGPVRTDKAVPPKVKTAAAVGKPALPVRLAAKRVDRACSQRSGARRSCREA